ncbi:hypothetical protein ACFQWA_20290 [Streptomyces thermogriseus]|jgi:hypothetical protein|uniref:hypothetical protein n=1 Tax=Streptomyces thermogriseus TaxID=75292 RepID=UPI0031F9D1A4
MITQRHHVRHVDIRPVLGFLHNSSLMSRQVFGQPMVVRVQLPLANRLSPAVFPFLHPIWRFPGGP